MKRSAATSSKRFAARLLSLLSLSGLALLLSCASQDGRRIGMSRCEQALMTRAPRVLIDSADAWKPYKIARVDQPLEMSVHPFTTERWNAILLDGSKPADGESLPDPELVLSGSQAASGAYAVIDHDLSKEPVLAWQWSLQVQGDAAQPVALMVGFDVPEEQASPETLAWAKRVEEVHGVRPPLRAIGYVYGGFQSMAVAESSFFAPASVFMINLRPRMDADGVWLDEQRDIARDYRNIFREDPPKLSAIAFIGDARGEEDQLEARLRRLATAPGGMACGDRAIPSVEIKHPPLLWWALGGAVLMCLFSGAWLAARVLGGKQENA